MLHALRTRYYVEPGCLFIFWMQLLPYFDVKGAWNVTKPLGLRKRNMHDTYSPGLHCGKLDVSATTTLGTPKLAKAPRIIPHGNHIYLK